MTISTDVVTWSTPAADFAYTLVGNEAMANVSLLATSAAGYGVTYAANTLPTGVSLSGNTVFGTPTTEQTIYTALTATANTTGRTATRYVSWSVVLGDAFWKYNTLLIPGASTTFVDDASTNNFAVSIFGDTKPNNTNPYTPGYYSNYFDGTGDYLSVSSNVALQFGSGSFTLECWIYITGGAGTRRQILGKTFAAATASDYSYSMEVDASNKLTFYVSNGSAFTSVSSSNTIGLNAWYHVASVRDGNTLRIFINGVAEGTTSFSSSINDNGSSLGIGITGEYLGLYFLGNISNLRIVKGTAVYTTAFTPSTTPLTAITNTSLLTCQSNRFIDNSTNNFTITVTGNTLISSFDPFVPNSSYSTYGSGYFDGTGDSLRLANNTALGMGTGDFTIEFWLYQTAISDYRQILDIADGNSTGRLILWVDGGGTLYNLGQNGNARNSTAGGAIKINTWTHVVLTRASGTTRFYINGTQSGSNYSDSTNYTCTTGTMFIGTNEDGGTYPYQGYLTDFRMVKGTAVYTTTFTPPSAPLTAITNTSLLTLQNNQSVNNNTFLDNSTNNLLVTKVGNATQGTFSPYGGNWSNYFDGTGDYLTLNGTPGTTLSGNFTLEAWVYIINFSAGRAIICIGDVFGDPGVMFAIDTAGKLGIYYANSRQYTGSGSLTANTWNHVAFVRNSGVITGYINGVSQGTLSTANTFSGTTSYIGLERYNGGAGGVIMFGYISNLRIVNSTAVYTGTFTPPTTPLTPITNTGLLTCSDNRLVDDSINNFTITKNGDVSVQRFSPFNPSSLTPTSYSGYFDGTGDYLSVASNAAFGFGTGDYTLEFWVYSVIAWSSVICLYNNNSGGYFLQYNTGTGLQTGIAGVSATGTYAVTLTSGAWNHIAVSRASGSSKCFVNGTQVGTTVSDTTNYAQNGAYIGALYEGSQPLTGYISNLRVVKGTAVYTSNFTPSTTPLTAIANTSLLTCQSTTFIDNSTNNFTITVAGNTKPTQQNPFGFTSTLTNGYTPSTIGGSTNTDNTGTIYSNVASPISGNANAWTMECWVYFNTISGNVFIMGLGNNTGGTTPYVDLRITSSAVTLEESSTVSGIWSAVATFACTTGQWYHFAATRSGSTIRLFINGVQLASTTYASAIQSGLKPFTQGLLFSSGAARSDGVNGYVSDTRMIAGTALYTSNFVPPAAPLQAITNTSWLINGTSAGIYDATMMNNMSTVGDAKLSTAISKFGGSSMSFDGTGDYLSSPTLPQYSFGTGNFTIEYWAYPTSGTNNGIFQQSDTAGGFKQSAANSLAMNIYTDNSVTIYANATTYTTGNNTLPFNTWTHLAIVRSSGVTKLYINGSLVTSIGTSGSITDTTNYSGTYLVIGGYYSTSYLWNGYIDDFRITKGYARYTSNFTPPTSAFQIK